MSALRETAFAAVFENKIRAAPMRNQFASRARARWTLSSFACTLGGIVVETAEIPYRAIRYPARDSRLSNDGNTGVLSTRVQCMYSRDARGHFPNQMDLGWIELSSDPKM